MQHDLRGRMKGPDRSFRTGAPLAVTLLLAALAGCGDDGPEACVFVTDDSGTTTMRCPDGSSVRFPSTEEEQPPGGIRGTIRLFGRQDHAGIRVEVRGHPDLVAYTEADGSYAIDEVPAGYHAVDISAPGYEDEEAEELVVLPGAWATEDAELRIGKRLLEGAEWELIPSPKDARFLAHQPNGDLHLIDPVAASARFLAGQVQDATFSPDGAWVIFKSGEPNPEQTGVLSLHDVARNSTRQIAESVFAWQLTPDRATFVVERRAGQRSTLETWHEPTGRRAGVAQDVVTWRVSGDGGAILASIRISSGLALVVWDVAASGGTGLGDVAPDSFVELPAFSPDHRSFVYRSVTGDGLLWHGGRQEASFLGALLAWHAFDDEGDQLLYATAQENGLFHWEVDTGSRFEIATGIVTIPAFSPGGQLVAYARIDGGEIVLSIWDRESRASTRVGTLPAVPHALRFDPTGRNLFVHDEAGALHLWRDGALRLLSPAAHGLPAFAPDGTSYLFVDGEELLWAETDGGEPLLLGAPVFGYPFAWSAGGDRLLFLTGASHDGDRGDAWVFHPETRHLEKVAEATLLRACDFLDDGSVIALQRYDRSSLRGELVRGGEVIATGVYEGPAFTPDGTRILFVEDVLPVRAEGVLTLWEPPRRECAPHPDGGRVECGGLVPIDGWVRAQLVGPTFLAWVAEPEDEARRGLYVAHFPADLPSTPGAPAAGRGELSDRHSSETHE